METPYTLIENLLKFDKESIKYALLQLMIEDKLDFHTLSNVYVDYLKLKEKDTTMKLIEAETCLLQTFHLKHTTNKTLHKGFDYINTQRSLHCLNESKRYVMEKLNEKYNYNEEIGKEASCYEDYKKQQLKF